MQAKCASDECFREQADDDAPLLRAAAAVTSLGGYSWPGNGNNPASPAEADLAADDDDPLLRAAAAVQLWRKPSWRSSTTPRCSGSRSRRLR